MTIPVGQEYTSETLGIGRISSYQTSQSDSAAAASDINWGAAVCLNANNPNQVKQYDGSSDFYGVAVAEHFTNSYLLTSDKEGKYQTFDAVNVLRKGIITVKVLEDVIKGQKAVADNATGNFRAKGTSATEVSDVIGEFKSTAKVGGLALLEISLP